MNHRPPSGRLKPLAPTSHHDDVDTQHQPAPPTAASTAAACVFVGDNVDNSDKISNSFPPRPTTSMGRRVAGFCEPLLQPPITANVLAERLSVDSLDSVTRVDLQVDTRGASLEGFGELVPRLEQLKLSGSMLSSVRDIGTHLQGVRVLWLGRCGLRDLDGISSLGRLGELYVAYNSVSDLSPLALLEHLTVIDLEGNRVSDIDQVGHLMFLEHLTHLTLEGNPICRAPKRKSKVNSSGLSDRITLADIESESSESTSDDDDEEEERSSYNYRISVVEVLPRLKVLDDKPVSAFHDGIGSAETHYDRRLVTRLIQKSALDMMAEHASEYERGGSNGSRGGEVRRPSTAGGQEESSRLTHGGEDGAVVVGNPALALRSRRKRSSHDETQVAAARGDGDGETVALGKRASAVVYGSVATKKKKKRKGVMEYDEVDEAEETSTREDVLEELRRWRAQLGERDQQLGQTVVLSSDAQTSADEDKKRQQSASRRPATASSRVRAHSRAHRQVSEPPLSVAPLPPPHPPPNTRPQTAGVRSRRFVRTSSTLQESSSSSSLRTIRRESDTNIVV